MGLFEVGQNTIKLRLQVLRFETRHVYYKLPSQKDINLRDLCFNLSLMVQNPYHLLEDLKLICIKIRSSYRPPFYT